MIFRVDRRKIELNVTILPQEISTQEADDFDYGQTLPTLPIWIILAANLLFIYKRVLKNN